MQLCYLINGIKTRIITTDRAFFFYCARFLQGFPTVDDIHVELEVHIESPSPFRDFKCGYTKWGTTVTRSGEVYCFCADEGADVYCEVADVSNELQRIHCYALVPGAKRLWRWARDRRGSAKQLWMTMIRQSVLVPALARALIQNGMVTLHASAVSTNERAVLLTGLNGCGKSGLALNLVSKHGFQFMSDNFTPVDPEMLSAFAFPEPLRVSESELGEAVGTFSGKDRAFGKVQMLPNQGVLCPCANVAYIIQVSIGDRFVFSRIAPHVCFDQFESVHRFVSETPEYSWIQLYYRLAHGVSLRAKADAGLRRLCQQLPCYEVVIPLRDDTEARYSEIVAWIHARLNARPASSAPNP